MSETATEYVGDEELTSEAGPGGLEVQADPEQGEQQEQAEKQEPDYRSEAEKWKSLSRKWEKDAKANAKAAERLAEIEDSQKTEQQRLADRAAAAEQRAIAAEIGRAKLIAAAAHNLPMSLLDRLGGSTEDEINEAAEGLAAEFEAEMQRRLAAMPPPPVPEPGADEENYSYPARTRPVESLTPGALPAGYEPADGNDFLRRLAGR